MRTRLGIAKWTAAVATSLAVAGGAYGLTASNTVPTSSAGSGSGSISGYVVTNVHYALNAVSPQNIDSVTFTLDSAPPVGSTLRVKLAAAATTYYSCTNVTVNVTCTTSSPQATVSAADQLSVIAAQ
jgi:hypothetical protein